MKINLKDLVRAIRTKADADKIYQKMSGKLRRLFLYVNPNYDWYGWKRRTELDFEFDITHPKAIKGAEWLSEIINLNNVKTILEIGCNSGKNLFNLAAKYPDIQILGVDFNKSAIEFATREAQKRGYHNLKFSYLDILDFKELSKLIKKDFDLVFTWATLIYIHRTKINKILEILLKNVNQIVLIEQHKSMRISYKGRLIKNNPTWIRDYEKMLKNLSSNKIFIKIREVPENIWAPGGGHARIVEVTKVFGDC
jgi:cyclopropane fatty-acyl-phospholipid synthase-like methyltransferase